VIGDLNPPKPEFENTDNLKFLKVNVTEWESLRNMFVQANEWYGRIDHVFANAGVAPTTDFLDVTLNEADQLEPPNLRTININLLGPIYTLRLASAYMTTLAKERPIGKGSIVLTASASSFQNFSSGDYTITKHGVLGMIRGLCNLLGSKDIRLNAVAPSWTATALVPPEYIAAMGGTVQTPEVVARSVALLFSEDHRHGDVIYSWEGHYREINNAEGGLLSTAARLLGNADNEESVMQKLRELKAKPAGS
jgi:NAD(P)-dependent dehydrogenase (short-subunit alcohol dehydrogenase family)